MEPENDPLSQLVGIVSTGFFTSVGTMLTALGPDAYGVTVC